MKEGELDVGAKIKECCSDTKNLSVAAHQPTKAVAASKEVRVRNSDNKCVTPERFFNPDLATLTNSTHVQGGLCLCLRRV